MKSKLNGRELLAIGYAQGKLLGMALDAAKDLKGLQKNELLALLKKLKEYPENFLDDEKLGVLAAAMVEHANRPVDETIALKDERTPYTIFGADYIEEGATGQMELAMRLPVTVAGALMPDAHQGYGLPIGGVLATRDAVIPYGVGVDIGCRMALSIVDIPPHHFLNNPAAFRRELIANTKFGAGVGFSGKDKADHPVLANDAFNLTPLTRQLKDKASTQLGSSGGGNHFVEWGIIHFPNADEQLNIEKGDYLALLTHSGSRGVGASIAGYYTSLAKQISKLPKEAANLAYLDMRSEAGQEYWLAMNLAGEFASACHEIIHRKLTRAMGAVTLAKVENHHNFAWKEKWNNEEVIVHRKGATPAARGIDGIIPGSMTAPGFLVRGKGETSSISSASHGAGRQMSRTRAVQTFSHAEMQSVLKQHQVTLIGAGLDEAPMAYKDINRVMQAQTSLVDIIARFTPKMVRMADDGSRED